jgi:glycosyltransferase involved in cell wall biosynthesis
MPLAIGAPAHIAPGTGVASYSRALVRAAEAFAPLIVDPGESRARWPRRLLALRPWPRRLARGDRSLFGRDLFREAQVHFDLYRRPLELVCPGPAGILHWTYPVPLSLRGWRNLYTVHDAIPLTAPQLTPIDGARHRRLLDALAKAAAGFVTVTEAARGEIVAALGCDPALVTNLGMPVDVEGAAATPRLGLRPGHYLLHCGTIEPRKNIARLVEAHRASGLAMPLVLAGPDGPQAETLDFAGAHVIRTGYLPRADVLRLIADARALVMPSLAEGFGLPVAEAMMLGTPVLTSDRGALAEVAGEAGLTVEVTDTAALAAAMTRLAVDDELCEELRRRGTVQARAYDLDAFAARLAVFYEKMGG